MLNRAGCAVGRLNRGRAACRCSVCVLWCGGAQDPVSEGVNWLVPSLQFAHVGVVVALGGLCVLKVSDSVVVW